MKKNDAYSRVKSKAPRISGIEFSAAGTHSNTSCQQIVLHQSSAWFVWSNQTVNKCKQKIHKRRRENATVPAIYNKEVHYLNAERCIQIKASYRCSSSSTNHGNEATG
jgi:hypothetical protein